MSMGPVRLHIHKHMEKLEQGETWHTCHFHSHTASLSNFRTIPWQFKGMLHWDIQEIPSASAVMLTCHLRPWDHHQRTQTHCTHALQGSHHAIPAWNQLKPLGLHHCPPSTHNGFLTHCCAHMAWNVTIHVPCCLFQYTVLRTSSSRLMLNHSQTPAIASIHFYKVHFTLFPASRTTNTHLLPRLLPPLATRLCPSERKF